MVLVRQQPARSGGRGRGSADDPVSILARAAMFAAIHSGMVQYFSGCHPHVVEGSIYAFSTSTDRCDPCRSVFLLSLALTRGYLAVVIKHLGVSVALGS